MPRSLRSSLLLLGFVALGCNQCGERRYLFPGLHERLSGDHDSSSSGEAKRSGSGKDCEGTAVSRNGSGFAGETLSYPGGVIYTGPSYPSGPPYIVPGGSRPDELPAPGYIAPPGVPSNPYATPRSIDSTKMLPKIGGTMTGDPRR